MKQLLIALASLVSISIQSHAQSQKVILAIFAHPDDESVVSPVLAKYAAEGASIYIAVATDGRYGVTEHAMIPGGDSLATVRIEEMKCAAQNLGINPPIMMGLHDQLKMKDGIDSMNSQMITMRNKVIELFTTLKPDVVITWGPSGWTGHPDHRLVGNIVSEVFGRKVWGKPANLYYPEMVSGSLPEPTFLATVDSAYLPVRIKVTPYFYEKAKASHACHKSQYTPADAAELQRHAWESQKGTAYFRPFYVRGKRQTSLF